jgi:hypothetical protein
MAKVDRIWAQFDHDGNGYLDEDEFFSFSASEDNIFPREECQFYME